MKHLSAQTEDQGFSLSSAQKVSCGSSSSVTMCGDCETCLVPQKVKEFQEWFSRFGDHSKKQFMLGLLRRIQCQTLLENLVLLLQPTITKDCIYARARTNPSLGTDAATVSSDHAISATKIEQVIATTWQWFSCASYFTKTSFTLSMLCACDAHLLHILYRQANTQLMTAELKISQALTEDDIYEVASISSNEYSHQLNEHKEIDLLSQSQCENTPMVYNHFTKEAIAKKTNDNVLENINDTSSQSAASSCSLDHDILRKPTSTITYGGVFKYKDFVRYLPVHLSKMILSMLDMTSLYNALCVSPNWRKLAEEVRFEIGVNQQIKEEVMLMQGAAAHSANPVYAKDIDVLVPNLEPGTHDVIYTNDDVIKTTFKSEHSFQTAYSGVSTRKVIMEERNIFCGTYNVMVVVDTEDSHRVIHTDGSNKVALGSKDRKVRFADCSNGKETGPIITGHAGSITCCYLIHNKDMVISGSYDTSVRCWSITTGKCLMIMRGHQDTVNCITVMGNVVGTGSMDKSCKLWSLETGKCQKTFKHRSSVLAVALSEEICISGCESGKVKVWELGSGNLIKILTGHHASVMGIKFDRWHIITGSKDGYALVWSTVGRHSRCLTALRHPKEVLCLEFAYLRVVTGSADGRIRIWNIVTGQCCRIMRGNSQSDPILSIIATGDRITVNTLNSLLVMNFEKINWDYTLETDKVSPLVQYASYSEAPFRSQPYSYVRAQRMRKAGASNCKIVHHSSLVSEGKNKHALLQNEHHVVQTPLSAKSLNSKSHLNAKHAHSSLRSLDTSFSLADTSSHVSLSPERFSVMDQSVESLGKKCSNSAQSVEKSKSRNKSVSSQVNIVVGKKPVDNEYKGEVSKTSHINRRVSWAFENPIVSKGKDISLSEMKALLRSQIRMKPPNIVPPDFISLTVSTIQKSMAKSGANCDTKINMLGWKSNSAKVKKRPSSSPSRIDPRTKVPAEKFGFEAFHNEARTVSPQTNLNPILLQKTREECKSPSYFTKQCFTTDCAATPFNTSLQASLHPEVVRTTIPQGLIIRPISAGPVALECRQASLKTLPPRPSTSPAKPDTARWKFVPLSISSSLPGAGNPTKSKYDHLSSAGEEASHVPMIMYTKQAKEKIAQLKLKRRCQQIEQNKSSSDGQLPTQTKMYNNPLRKHVKFELLTHQQEQENLQQSELFYADQKRKENEELQKKKKHVWLKLARGLSQTEQAT